MPATFNGTFFIGSGGGGGGPPPPGTAVTTISTNAILVSPPLNAAAQNTALAALSTATAGSFSITINGTVYNITGLNLAGLSLVNCAATISTAINTALGITQTAQNWATCQFWELYTPNTNATPNGSLSFIIYSPLSGAASTMTYLSPVSPPTGQDISSALQMNSSSGALLTQGSDTVFNESSSTALSTYVDPVGRFTQTNTVVSQTITSVYTNTFRVFYRRHTASSIGTLNRFEVVIETGLYPQDTVQLNNGPYTATVTQGGSTIYSQFVPWHGYRSRWRFTPVSAPFYPVTGSLAALRTAHLIPNYDTSIYNGHVAPPSLAHISYTPMSPLINNVTGAVGFGFLAGQVWGQGEPGDTETIYGLLSAYCAYYCLSPGTSGLLNVILTQAESVSCWPYALRDTSNAPSAMPPADFAAKYAAAAVMPVANFPATSDEGVIDNGHLPSVTYLPFMLTGDPYYLETIQFECMVPLATLPPQSFVSYVGRFNGGGGRYHAVPMRTMILAYLATLNSGAAGCNWLLPASTYLSGVNSYSTSNNQWFTSTGFGGNATGAWQTVFSGLALFGTSTGTTAPYAPGTGFDFWQQGLQSMYASFALYAGVPDTIAGGGAGNGYWINHINWLANGAAGRAASASNVDTTFFGTISNGSGGAGADLVVNTLLSTNQPTVGMAIADTDGTVPLGTVIASGSYPNYVVSGPGIPALVAPTIIGGATGWIRANDASYSITLGNGASPSLPVTSWAEARAINVAYYPNQGLGAVFLVSAAMYAVVSTGDAIVFLGTPPPPFAAATTYYAIAGCINCVNTSGGPFYNIMLATSPSNATAGVAQLCNGNNVGSNITGVFTIIDQTAPNEVPSPAALPGRR